MYDFHAIQMTGTACQGRNCAAATAAADIYFGTRGRSVKTADEVRKLSGVSCVPGHDTPSGGLSVPAIERVCAMYGVSIDFGPGSTLARRNITDVYVALSTYYTGHLLGMYSSVRDPWRAHGSTFQGGHSVMAHDVRDDLPDSHYGKVQRTACWHDPLRPRPIRVPWSVIERYTQSDTPLRGFAGFVKVDPPAGATYATPMTDRTRTAFPSVAVHKDRTTGKASTVRIIRPEGKLVELALYAPGQEYKGSKMWGATSLIGNEWIHLKRLSNVKGGT